MLKIHFILKNRGEYKFNILVPFTICGCAIVLNTGNHKRQIANLKCRLHDPFGVPVFRLNRRKSGSAFKFSTDHFPFRRMK